MGSALERCRNIPQTLATMYQEDDEDFEPPTNEQKKFNPFFQPNSQATAEVKFFERFRFISNYEDRFMGRCTVVQELESATLYLLKEMEYASDVKCREMVERYKNKKQSQADMENLLRIVVVG
jgi:hypothetical protein